MHIQNSSRAIGVANSLLKSLDIALRLRSMTEARGTVYEHACITRRHLSRWDTVKCHEIYRGVPYEAGGMLWKICGIPLDTVANGRDTLGYCGIKWNTGGYRVIW